MRKTVASGLEEILDSFLKERSEIDTEVSELLNKRKAIDDQIANINETYITLTGKNYEKLSELRPAADLAEELLMEFGELHVDRMLELMAERKLLGNREIPKQSLVSTLVRYIQQKKRFKRVEGKPNTFALIKEGE
jgi:hypothetical protein